MISFDQKPITQKKKREYIATQVSISRGAKSNISGEGVKVRLGTPSVCGSSSSCMQGGREQRGGGVMKGQEEADK